MLIENKIFMRSKHFLKILNFSRPFDIEKERFTSNGTQRGSCTHEVRVSEIAIWSGNVTTVKVVAMAKAGHLIMGNSL